MTVGTDRWGSETPPGGQPPRASGDALPAGISPLATGDPTSIGPYPLLGRVGRGGMGNVYLSRGLATGSSAGRFVAVKVIRADLADNPMYRDRFAREVAAARRVASFCTAQVVDADPAGDPPYLVTEFVQGVRLDRVISTDGPLPTSTLSGMAVGVAAAITAIHAAGLAHRDLKPANVLLSWSGPRVIDFGIARDLDVVASVTGTGLMVGSPGWMAPEQLLAGRVTAAADVFAWGCLVAYAGTGRHPFQAEDMFAIAHKVLSEEPDLAGLPPALLPLVTAALDKDAARRPTAQALLLSQLGGTAGAPDQGAAVSQVLDRTWTPPPVVPAAGARPAGAAGAGPAGAAAAGPAGAAAAGAAGGAVPWAPAASPVSARSTPTVPKPGAAPRWAPPQAPAGQQQSVPPGQQFPQPTRQRSPAPAQRPAAAQQGPAATQRGPAGGQQYPGQRPPTGQPIGRETPQIGQRPGGYAPTRYDPAANVPPTRQSPPAAPPPRRKEKPPVPLSRMRRDPDLSPYAPQAAPNPYAPPQQDRRRGWVQPGPPAAAAPPARAPRRRFPLRGLIRLLIILVLLGTAFHIGTDPSANGRANTWLHERNVPTWVHVPLVNNP